MNKYLQSTTVGLEEWRTKRTDTEQWMHHRQLPQELRESVRRYEQYKWAATRGVDEDALLSGLPVNLQRQIKRHLGLHLICKVPLLPSIDEMVQELLLERLKPTFFTKGTFLVREGHPLSNMTFISHGRLSSFSTNTSEPGTIHSNDIGQGSFCGERLLEWSLHPNRSVTLPSSPRTVQAISEVEAFTITAEDLIVVGILIREARAEELRHKFRFYSSQWRMWATCYIQKVWRMRRHRHRM